MTQVVTAILLTAILTTPALAWQRPKGEVRRIIPRRMVQDSMLAFYTREFRRVAAVSDEVFAKIYPLLEQFVDERFEISQRRQQAMNRLQRLVNGGGADEELKRTVREIDEADKEIQANQENLLSQVDPHLNTVQQAQLRIFQQMADNRVRQALAGVRDANQNRLPASDLKKE